METYPAARENSRAQHCAGIDRERFFVLSQTSQLTCCFRSLHRYSLEVEMVHYSTGSEVPAKREKGKNVP